MFGLDAILGAAQGLPGFLTGLLPDQGPPPPPEPSLLDDPAIQAALAGLGNTMSGFQGVADQFLNPAGQAGSYSPEYRAGLSGGGTGAQNARFERMYDPRKAESDALASLMNDPVFGHLFGGGNSAPNVTSYTESQPVPEITNETIAAMRAAGQLDGTSGVRLAPEQQSQALQRRLDRRAEEQAALENMRWSPMDSVDPMQKMAFAYEAWAADQQAAERAMERQRQAAIQQTKMLAEKEARTEEARRFDATLKADSDYQNSMLGMEGRKLGLLESEAARESANAGRLLSPAEYLTRKQQLVDQYGDAIGLQKLDEEMRMLGRQFGGGTGSLDFGLSLDPVLDLLGLGGMSLGGDSPAQTAIQRQLGGKANAEFRGGLKPLGPEGAFDKMTIEGPGGVPMSDAEALAVIEELFPGLYGSTAENPGGSSAFWQGMKAVPGSPAYFDSLLGNPLERFMGGDPNAAWDDFRKKAGLPKPGFLAPTGTPTATLSPVPSRPVLEPMGLF